VAELAHRDTIGESFQPRYAGRRGRARAHGPRMLRAGGLAALALLVATLVAPGIASAHASYKSSDPKPNAILKSAPASVKVTFQESVNPQGSDLIVYDARGNKVSTAPGQVDRADLTTMTVPMKGNGSEIYMVQWHTVSVDDGDPDIGAFNFLVNPSASTVQAVTGGAHTTASPASAGMPIWLGVLVGVLGLVVGGGGEFLLARRMHAQAAAGRPAPAPNRTS
jgi:methionine-rich copper-binding protein CopC